MDDLISRKAAIEAIVSQSIYETREAITEAMLNDYKKSDEWLGGIDDAISTIEEMNAIPAVPLDKLCEFLADTLHTPAPCYGNEEICPHMDFGYCRLPDTPDVKECWKRILTKWMEGLDGNE